MKRVREFIQNYSYENGAVCLAMICDYFGHRISVDEACDICDVNVNGCSSEAICFGAEEIGLKAKKEDISIEKITKEKIPCIAVLKDEKYATIEFISKKSVLYCDPVEGHKKISLNEFNKIYDGTIITFAKKEEFKKTFWKNSIYKILQIITQERKVKIAIYVGVMLFSSVICIIKPEAIKKVTDSIFYSSDKMKIVMISFYVLICILDILILYFPIIFGTKIKQKISVNSDESFILGMLNLPSKTYDRIGEDDLILRRNESAELTESITSKLLMFLIDVFTVLLCTCYIISQSIYILHFILATCIIVYIVFLIQTPLKEKMYKVMRYYLQETLKIFYTGLSMLDTIKYAGTEYIFFRKHVDNIANATKAETEWAKIDLYGNVIPNILFSLMQIIIIVIGVYEALYNRNITFSSILACYFAYNMMRMPLQNILQSSTNISLLENTADRVLTICNNKNVVSDNNTSDFDIVKSDGYLEGKIEVKGVDFAYSKFSEPFIKNLNITIHRGEHVAIVGKSGSGKTTIKNILIGRYEPQCGEILFDGIDSRKIAKRVILNSIAAVDQKIVLFPNTVSNNIKMWDSTIEDYEVVIATNDALIYNTIIERENDFQSMITEKGSNFSGGECQRIEIARALAREPRILILDEATSTLDAKTEKQVVDNINARGITTITIAHRLSTIRNSDNIFVVDNGSIVAEGKHDYLMNECELYRSLVLTE